jgi:hypothetical protein
MTLSRLMLASGTSMLLALAACSVDRSGSGKPMDRAEATVRAPSPSASSFSAVQAPTRTGSGLVAPGEHRAAGACSGETSRVITIFVEPDTPMPRCAVVGVNQQIRVVNRTTDFGQAGKSTTVTLADFEPVTLQPGEGVTYPATADTFLAPGSHLVSVSFYGEGGFEILFRPEVRASSTSGGVRIAIPTHCGVLSVIVEGRLWLADPPLGDHNPPPGWDENRVSGEFVLGKPGHAEFHGDSGEHATFRLASDGASDPNAGCE